MGPACGLAADLAAAESVGAEGYVWVLVGGESLDKFKGMLQGRWAWGNIEDVVRFRAAFEVSAKTGSWVLDIDTWWLQALKASNCPSASGDIVATCAGRRRISGDQRYWKHRYLREPGERTYALPPMYFTIESAILSQLLWVCIFDLGYAGEFPQRSLEYFPLVFKCIITGLYWFSSFPRGG